MRSYPLFSSGMQDRRPRFHRLLRSSVSTKWAEARTFGLIIRPVGNTQPRHRLEVTSSQLEPCGIPFCAVGSIGVGEKTWLWVRHCIWKEGPPTIRRRPQGYTQVTP